MSIGVRDLFGGIHQCASTRPESQAVLAPGRTPLASGDLWAGMEAFSAGDAAFSLTALLLPDGPELLTALLNVMHGGGAAWPLNPALTIAELERQLSLLRPDRAILGPGISPAVEDLLHSLRVRVRRATWDPSAPAGVFKLSEAPRDQRGATLSTETLSSETRLVLVSSGTTGVPKIVPLSDGNLRAMLRNSRRCYQLTSDGRYLGLAPLFHLHGIANALAQLTAGGSVVCPDGFDADAFPAWLRHYRPTWYAGGPAVHRAVASLAASGAELCTQSLRFVRSSSAPLDLDTQAAVERALGVPVIDSYGLTECSAIAVSPLPPGRRKPGSCGVSAGADISIINFDHLPVPAGVEGEILVRGPNVFAGYWGDPAANAEAFRDGWFRTGDLGRLDEEGYLFITGRLKDVINRGGMKLMPAEVDAVLLGHPGVAQAVAFGAAHPSLGEDLEAAVVVRSGTELTEAQLRAHVAAHLSPYKVPRRIHFTNSIPTAATGKPQRAELRRMFEQVPQSTGQVHRALTLKESRIAGIWSRVLNRQDITPGDSFYGLGGDSLAAAIVFAELQREFALDQPVSRFFEQPTLEHLARLVSERKPGGPRPPAVHLAGAGPNIPVFCIPAVSGDPLYLRHLAVRTDSQHPFFALTTSFEPDSLSVVEEIATQAAADIRATRPSGPYILAGHCFGGVVAFEAAHRLLAEGEAVRLVVLLDSPTPGYPKIARHWKRYAPAAWELLRSGGPGKLLGESKRHVRMLASQRRRAKPGSKPPLHDYSPGPLDVPVLQVLSTNHHASTRVLEDERLGWRDFAPAGFQVVQVPGDHDSFLLPPDVDHTARAMRAVLDQVSAEKRHALEAGAL